MIISRQLKVALLISLLGHMLCLASFSIIFLSHKLETNRYYSVNFLGSIFRNTAFAARGTFERSDAKEFTPLEALSRKKDYFSERPQISLPVERKSLNPDSIIDELKAAGPQRPFAASFVQPERLTPQRKVIFKPVFSAYPEWAQQPLKEVSATFKVSILPDGLVQQTINLKTCGNPEIDAALARYLTRWRFAPAAGQKNEWQTIKIGLKLDDKTGI